MARNLTPVSDSEDRLERLSVLVRKERGALASIARSEGLSPEEALECVQDALCTFLARDDVGEHAVASLKTIVRNEARNLRRRAHRASLPLQDDHAAVDSNADELLAHAEDVVRLRLCVASLCEVQRAVVTLRLLEERSGEDVATTLGITRGYVDVLTHRAKASLRVCMRQHG
jgi:RNA polymerase sigma-70 factor, ECF subfamily